MILKRIEYEGAEWTVVFGPQRNAPGPYDLELVFVRDGDGGRMRYGWPMKETGLLEELHRDPTEVSDELLRRLLKQAISDDRRLDEG